MAAAPAWAGRALRWEAAAGVSAGSRGRKGQEARVPARVHGREQSWGREVVSCQPGVAQRGGAPTPAQWAPRMSPPLPLPAGARPKDNVTSAEGVPRGLAAGAVQGPRLDPASLCSLRLPQGH